MKNDYEIRGDTTAIFLNSPKYGRMETLIATSDLPRAQLFVGTWYPNWHKGTRSFYVQGKVRNESGNYGAVKLHRWLMQLTDQKKCVDHVMHDTLDNCKWALRVVTQAENAQNNRVSKRNQSGYPGVSRNKRLGKWKAHIRVNYKLIHLGYFESKEEAIAVRRLAENTHYEYLTKIS